MFKTHYKSQEHKKKSTLLNQIKNKTFKSQIKH